jgi:hypothetical protein
VLGDFGTAQSRSAYRDLLLPTEIIEFFYNAHFPPKTVQQAISAIGGDIDEARSVDASALKWTTCSRLYTY